MIKASKISGLENASVTQFLGDMYQRINATEFYRSLGKGFHQSDFGYRYRVYINTIWCELNFY